eukprot:TRINITY_DN5603_c0_g1_i1.p1 TRINITY_DN5603_c0_g1~~TRINITY_DN5603_c0_g1_i1.p1  ORF type:complete len:198 (+),score=0.23 TRINITY_DN5603_c0_g1_i1:1201-1794(+)
MSPSRSVRRGHIRTKKPCGVEQADVSPLAVFAIMAAVQLLPKPAWNLCSDRSGGSKPRFVSARIVSGEVPALSQWNVYFSRDALRLHTPRPLPLTRVADFLIRHTGIKHVTLCGELCRGGKMSPQQKQAWDEVKHLSLDRVGGCAIPMPFALETLCVGSMDKYVLQSLRRLTLHNIAVSGNPPYILEYLKLGSGAIS